MWSSFFLTLLLFVVSLGWLSAFLLDGDFMTPEALSKPHFTQCVSREQETFRCWWSVGNFQNLSYPGGIRLFYHKKEEWKECPEYIHSNRECYFDAKHTSIWTWYCVALRTPDNVTYFNEADCFTVENIVRPDPPVALNWTLLSLSPSGLHYDVIVHWEPPPSADDGGWMSLEYEIQYRGRNGTEWKSLEVTGSTKQTIYALHVEEDHEVHIHSKLKAFKKFGQFSDSIFIQLKIPVKVRPDPPVALNWTLLSISPSGLHYDVIIHWEPPPSADFGSAWTMLLDYEIQYRGRNSTEWKSLEVKGSTKQTINGLHVEENYEVHIRSKRKAFKKFSQFSDSIFIQLTEIPVKESAFPVSLVLVFGIVAMGVVIMLIVFSQQRRLTLLLFPPVPTPKIKGIDPDMLKKGKLEELSFILSSEGKGLLPSCTPHFYQDEPLVEFIEVDPEDSDGGEKDSQGSDTQRLLSGRQTASQRTNEGHSQALSFSDDALGEVSCFEPEQVALMLMTTLLPGQPEVGEVLGGLDVADRPQVWANTDFYAQVTDVTPSGGVVLSPGQQLRALESTGEEQAKRKAVENQSGKDSDGDAAEKRPTELRFQLLVVHPATSGYTGDWQVSTPSILPRPVNGYHTLPTQPIETTLPTAAVAEDHQSSYSLPEASASQFLPPVSDYTVVQEVDCQRSLLLNPPTPQSPSQCLPQHPLKALSAMPVGYITPDLLGNLSP